MESLPAVTLEKVHTMTALRRYPGISEFRKPEGFLRLFTNLVHGDP